MAPKRPSPLETNPPSASETSNDAETDSESTEIEQSPVSRKQQNPNPEPSSDEESSEEGGGGKGAGSDSDEEEAAVKPSADKSSSSETESDSGEENLTSAKPAATSAKKTAPIPNPSASKAALRKEPPKTKKAAMASNGKSPIPRLWSEDDELAILKGLAEYWTENEEDPTSNLPSFHEFVKKSLHVEVTKTQLSDKIRRLKKKYKNALEKAPKGEDPVFSKPHDVKSFELSKRIWDKDGVFLGNASAARGSSSAKKVMKEKDTVPAKRHAESGGEKSSIKRAKKAAPSAKENGGDEVAVVEAPGADVGGDPREGSGEDGFWDRYPRLREAMEVDKLGHVSEGGKMFMQEVMTMTGVSKVKAMEEKWLSFRRGEVERHVEWLDLQREQAQMVLDTLKSARKA